MRMPSGLAATTTSFSPMQRIGIGSVFTTVRIVFPFSLSEQLKHCTKMILIDIRIGGTNRDYFIKRNATHLM